MVDIVSDTKPIEENDLVPKAHVDSLLINFARLLGEEAIQVLLDMGYTPVDFISFGMPPSPVCGKGRCHVCR